MGGEKNKERGMDRKKVTILISGIALVIAAVLIFLSRGPNNTSTNSQNAEMKLISVDKLVESPRKFAGIVSVEGRVTEIIDNKKIFTLGCEDACIGLPVAYKGAMPKLESNIIALGEVKKDVDGKFFFDAKEIKYQ